MFRRNSDPQAGQESQGWGHASCSSTISARQLAQLFLKTLDFDLFSLNFVEQVERGFTCTVKSRLFPQFIEITINSKTDKWINFQQTISWYGEEDDLEDFAAYEFYGHKCEHSVQVNVFTDRFKPGGG
jgi:hypothetical protein